ncbi:DnaB-like helicase C-terminal domain-containing protein [Candidatus Puniceispirillum marinum]|uniref:DNA primase n=1 Tax=Puniceispirillum marinum (strain IMCC1322) TaxID=488538 RepID=D5BQS2_PUNMI|nr:DnaB-like helicase C-terminal domain-containing protein [Candidatus Puniceispirillum marinum]ADE38636.1 DNA primase [Candidatus Puniceispirillum marinum IMCC1322]
MQITNDEQTEFIRHESCPKCGSSDALAVYGDSATQEVHHGWCFSCQTFQKGDNVDGSYTNTPKRNSSSANLLDGEYNEIKSRGLTEETCRKFNYTTAIHNGEPVQVATYLDENGRPVAQKVRTKSKKFTMLGDAKAATLYGSHLYKTGKKLVICEGEIDAMTVSQVQGHKWATVSLTQGCSSAVKTMKNNWEFITKFEEVILMFDMDSVGQKAAQEAAATLPVGKAKIAYLPCKDANECLLQGKSAEIIQAIYQAREYRPDGIVVATDYRDVISEDDQASSVTYPYSNLNEIFRGLRLKEILLVAAGSGTGKTTFVKEIAYHLHQQGERVGLIMLEESNKRSLLSLVGTHMNKNVLVDRSEVTDDEIIEAFDDLFGEGRNPVYLYDHWGSSDVDLICQRITYMAKVLGIKWVFLDHISMLCTQMGGSSGFGSERLIIDYAMTKLRTMVQELDIGLILVSHVKRPDGNSGHESGGQPVRLNHLRGSSSLGQLSDGVIALNVDSDEPDSDIRHLHILKNRFCGATGYSGTLRYDRDTSRLVEEELAHLFEQEEDDEETEEAQQTGDSA